MAAPVSNAAPPPVAPPAKRTPEQLAGYSGAKDTGVTGASTPAEIFYSKDAATLTDEQVKAYGGPAVRPFSPVEQVEVPLTNAEIFYSKDAATLTDEQVKAYGGPAVRPIHRLSAEELAVAKKKEGNAEAQAKATVKTRAKAAPAKYDPRSVTETFEMYTSAKPPAGFVWGYDTRSTTETYDQWREAEASLTPA